MLVRQPPNKNKKRKILMQLIILKLKKKIQRDALFTILCKSPKKHHYRIRISWQDELQNMLLENSFETTTRMPSVAAFYDLVELLRPGLTSKNRKYVSSVRNIEVEFKVYLTLRILAGGDPLDIHKTIGISKYSVYRHFQETLHLINNIEALSIDLPAGEYLVDIKKGFAKLSGDREFEDSTTRPTPMKGCVGALDGYLALMNTPICDGSSDYYFSGHYFHHGLNVQAMCDHQCKFTYFNVVAPGKCPDSVAMQQCTDLQQWLDSLPTGSNDNDCFFILADAAYTCNRKVLTPFKGSMRLSPSNDAYNFYLSQIRIRIEQSFGLLSNKWRILRMPLGSDIGRAVRILNGCARLHNFIIERREVISENNEFNADDDIEVLFSQNNVNLGYIPSDVEEISQDQRRASGYDPSLRAQIISNRIIPGNWSRPNYNIVRNNNN